MRITIVGAGIGGCVAALLLDESGHDVCLFEAIPEPAPLGVGINLLPHAVSILDRLGLADQLEMAGIATRELAYFNKYGQQIWGEARGRSANYPVPQISIHRGVLQMALYREVLARLGHDRVLTGHRFEQYDDTKSIVATFRRPNETTVRMASDLLIGADGIHSTLRQMCYPEEGLPAYGGRVLWRAVTQAKPFLGGATMVMAGHLNCKFVAYPINLPGSDGRQAINWIAELPRTAMPERENWNREGNKADFAGAFATWQFDWLDVPALIEGAERVFEFPLVDRDPLPRWSFGATTLLGDAAHPMYPVGSNGASQAILDADALCRALARHPDPITALHAYEVERLPATAAIVLANRRQGPEQCLQIAEERAPNGFADIEECIPRAELEAIAMRYKTVAGFSREAVSARLRTQA